MLKEVLVLVGVCFHIPGNLEIGRITGPHRGLQKHNLGNYRGAPKSCNLCKPKFQWGLEGFAFVLVQAFSV